MRQMRSHELEILSELGHVTVHLAALICTLEDTEEDWTNEELAPFLQSKDQSEESVQYWTATHTWLNAPLVGRLKAKHAEVQSSLVQSIERREIVPLFLRRNRLGQVDPIQTRLDIDDFADWARTHDCLLDDLWDDWLDGEIRLQEHCISAAIDFRSRLSVPKGSIKPDGQELLTEADELLTMEQLRERLIRLTNENSYLRHGGISRSEPSARSSVAERPLVTRERDTLLALISVLAEELKIDWAKPSKSADVIVGMADRQGVKIGLRTVSEHLKAASSAREKRMP